MRKEANVSDLIGRVLVSVEVNKENDRITFTDEGGKSWLMFHHDDCCESVSVEDIVGELKDLIGSPILMAEEVMHENENPADAPVNEYQDSFTWTFYKLATIKGYVTIRWYGESNGYYSESVSFEEVN